MKDETKHVELRDDGLRTRVQFPPPPPDYLLTPYDSVRASATIDDDVNNFILLKAVLMLFCRSSLRNNWLLVFLFIKFVINQEVV